MSALKMPRLLAGALALSLTLSLSACSGSDSAKDDSGKSDRSSSEEKDSKDKKDEEKSDKKSEERPAITAEPKESAGDVDPALLAIIEQSKNLDLSQIPGGDAFESFDVRAEAPSTLVYEYTFKEGLVPPAEGLEAGKSIIEKQIEPLKKLMEAQGVNDPHIRYIYLDPAGKVIWDVEF